MKAADIPDEAFLTAVRSIEQRKGSWANRYEIGAYFPDAPEKVVLAKARILLRRRLLHGCGCGCRGDFTVKGLE